MDSPDNPLLIRLHEAQKRFGECLKREEYALSPESSMDDLQIMRIQVSRLSAQVDYITLGSLVTQAGLCDKINDLTNRLDAAGISKPADESVEPIKPFRPN